MAQIAIIGLGIVGTSLGMAIGEAIKGEKGRRTADVAIVGYDRIRQSAEQALMKKGVDHVAANLGEAVRQANLVILAESTPEIAKILPAIAPHLSAGCVVTDTASSKVEVLKLAEQALPANVHFVGGHPIIHPDQEIDWSLGVRDSARADLFKDGIYCLVPSPRASEQAVNAIKDLAFMVGADPFFVDSWEHDGLMGGLVEAPYLLSAAMLDATAASSAWRDLKLLTDPTFRYLNQVLRSQPESLYQECLVNRQPLLSWLDRVAENLQQLRKELATEGTTGEVMQDMLVHALNARDDWAKRRDERRKELDIAGMEQVASAHRTFLSLFVPSALVRDPRKKDEES